MGDQMQIVTHLHPPIIDFDVPVEHIDAWPSSDNIPLENAKP